MKLIFTVLLSGFLLSACCTKKDCHGEYPPEIQLSFSGFTNVELNELTLLLLDKQNSQVLDSIPRLSKSAKLSNNWHILERDHKTLRDYNFVIRTQTTSDTISDINYKEEQIMISCNQCLFYDGREEVTMYKDFSYRFKGQTLSADTLIISK